jgi:hypothetical protein
MYEVVHTSKHTKGGQREYVKPAIFSLLEYGDLAIYSHKRLPRMF